jgi:hypothetical protein
MTPSDCLKNVSSAVKLTPRSHLTQLMCDTGHTRDEGLPAAARRRLSCPRRLSALVAFACCCLPAKLGAQVPLAPDPAEAAPIHFGTVSVAPGFALSSGYDSNIDQSEFPVKDYETYAVPQVKVYWRTQRLKVTGNAAQEFIHLQHNSKDSEVNWRVGGSVEYVGGAFEAQVTWDHPRTNARPTGYEIGAKSLRIENEYTFSTRTRLGARTTVTTSFNHTGISYDADAIYFGTSLQQELNRQTNGLNGSLHYAITPLTSLAASAEVSRDRFVYSPERNGNSVKFLGGANIATPALIVGNAYVGYREFRSPQSGAIGFAGAVWTANLLYLPPSGAIARIRLDRDVNFSFDPSLAYYLLTTLDGVYSRKFGRSWYGTVFGNRSRLDYREAGLPGSLGRVDTYNELGVEAGYLIGRWTRVGLSSDYLRKVGGAPFTGWRVVTLLTYGNGDLQRLDRPIPFTQ